MTVYEDSDHAHAVVSRRHPRTLKTSAYVSELVEARMPTKRIVEICFMLRSLGVELEGQRLMLGDNMSVFLNASVPSSDLKKFEEEA